MNDSAFAGRGETVKETVERALVPRIVDLPPARFALERRPGQDVTRLLCVVKPLAGPRRQAGRSAPRVGTAAGR